MLANFWRRVPTSTTTCLTGRARVDARTKNLCARLKPGEVAIIDHADLDGAAAYALLERRPVAVLNAAPAITGRYPNQGPRILLDHGIPLLDQFGGDLLDRVREGQTVEVRGETLWCEGSAVATGRRITAEIIEQELESARRNLVQELRGFARNTLEYLDRETDVALAEIQMPPLRVSMRGRPVLVVVRGEGYKQDLSRVQPFIREQRPALIAVDGGADALLEAGYQPDLIVGDMDSASERALRCGAQLVVHTYADGRRSPGLERVRQLELTADTLSAPGMSEDVAMLMAFQSGASLIVAVGTHFSLVEFLDKRRSGMASTLLTRLRVGSILVDAKGLSRLYRPSLSPTLIVGVLGAALLPVLVVVANSAGLQRWIGFFGMSVEVWLRRHGLR